MTDDRSPDRDLRARAGALRAAFPASSTRTAPVEQGKRLATVRRGDDELRVTWATFEGREFLSLRVWSKGADGQHWPGKQGVTVRAHELADIADGIGEALDLARAYAATLSARGTEKGRL